MLGGGGGGWRVGEANAAAGGLPHAVLQLFCGGGLLNPTSKYSSERVSGGHVCRGPGGILCPSVEEAAIQGHWGGAGGSVLSPTIAGESTQNETSENIMQWNAFHAARQTGLKALDREDEDEERHVHPSPVMDTWAGLTPLENLVHVQPADDGRPPGRLPSPTATSHPHPLAVPAQAMVAEPGAVPPPQP